MKAQTQTAIRLPDALLKRIDKLAECMSELGMAVTRAEVLRRAAYLGVEQLEAKQKKGTSR
jgi:predicted transcriptional regulator